MQHRPMPLVRLPEPFADTAIPEESEALLGVLNDYIAELHALNSSIPVCNR